MQQLEFQKLLDKAKAIHGSDYRVAAICETNPQALSNYRTGLRTCPIDKAVLIAVAAGEDPKEWALRAVLWKYEGTPSFEKMVRILGKVRRLRPLDS